MSTATVAPPSTSAELEQRLALIACGENSWPGKTRACDDHLKKSSTWLRITSTGAVDALAAAICGSGHRHNRSCQPCTEKAVRCVSVYNAWRASQ
ncbi:hypothetical protein EV284_6458 [Streptomyces sp. BK022]|uniref:hypothetical protein n=1 Tax=Streptomyces sp. BK022 TaxID=2512123 RepID=UPI001028A5E4|nr:hypothetical protein [Streptomyces sp. BK022]RZU28292.1 hypothetical protein EV284_6458 [Streptomyces sp. BK022]